MGRAESTLSSSFSINKNIGSLTYPDQSQVLNLQKVMSADSKSPPFVILHPLLSLVGSEGRESACRFLPAGNLGSIPGLGISLGEGKGYPLQYSGLENSKKERRDFKERREKRRLISINDAL